jgi:hypothetical protein
MTDTNTNPISAHSFIHSLRSAFLPQLEGVPDAHKHKVELAFERAVNHALTGGAPGATAPASQPLKPSPKPNKIAAGSAEAKARAIKAQQTRAANKAKAAQEQASRLTNIADAGKSDAGAEGGAA